MISPGQRFTEGPAQGPAEAAEQPSDGQAPHPLEPLLAHIGELREYASTYLAARLDRMKLTGRMIAFWAVVGLLAGVMGLAAAVTAVVLLMLGIADGLAALLGNHAWAGYLLCGGGFLVVLTVALVLFKRSWFRTSRRRTIEKYERRHQAQRAAYGHDVAQRARHR